MKFIDEAAIYVSSGNGGAGSVHFRREKFIPKGGPDGGDGGVGGSVIIEATDSIYSLLDYKYRHEYRAKSGQSGGGQNRSGASADDIVLKVPVGTVVYEYDAEFKRKKRQLADLSESNQKIKVATGGQGGKGNWFFRSATHQAPKFSQPGESGESKWIFLEVRLLADVGLVGFPNAGKSTLIRSISNAKPRVADYPFTTLEPHLGIVRQFEKDIVMSDLPGLIEGASEGVGLGIKFLKHIERNKCLLFILNCDPHAEQSPLKQYESLKQEVFKYNPELAGKKSLVALNKIDILDTETIVAFQQDFENIGLSTKYIFPISAATKAGLPELLKALFKAVYT
jgi:GTPase